MICSLAHLAAALPRARWTPCCSVNRQPLYQGLCTCFSVFLEYSSPERTHPPCAQVFAFLFRSPLHPQHLGHCSTQSVQ